MTETIQYLTRSGKRLGIYDKHVDDERNSRIGFNLLRFTHSRISGRASTALFWVLESGLRSVDDFTNAGDLADDTLTCECFGGKRKDEAHHGGAAV